MTRDLADMPLRGGPPGRPVGAHRPATAGNNNYAAA
jgi:hypothetical protein